MTTGTPGTPDVLEVRDRIRSGELKAVEAVGEALRQIRQVDSELHAATGIFDEEALARAEEIDRALARGDDVGSLAGVPYTVKENICTRWGTSSAASRILPSRADR